MLMLLGSLNVFGVLLHIGMQWSLAVGCIVALLVGMECPPLATFVCLSDLWETLIKDQPATRQENVGLQDLTKFRV